MINWYDSDKIDIKIQFWINFAQNWIVFLFSSFDKKLINGNARREYKIFYI